jgi:hyperosmotically inducible periplasmic protein
MWMQKRFLLNPKPLVLALTCAFAAPAVLASDQARPGDISQDRARYSTQDQAAQGQAQQQGQQQGQARQPEPGDRDGRFREGWVAGKLNTVILLNNQLNPFDIDTDVRGTTAYLRGEVESESERELATNLALGVDGIDRVVNQLQVNPDVGREQRDPERRGFTQTVNDATTTAVVKSKLLAEGDVTGTDINVTTEQGIVILEGSVDSQQEKELAEQIASETEGVRDVRNQLAVN